jgi:phage terminase small subunit
MKIALVDIRRAYNPDGSPKPLHQVPDDVAFAIAGVDVDNLVDKGRRTRRSVSKRIRFCDRMRALELLGKHLRLFTDKMEFTGNNPNPPDLSGLTKEQLVRLAELDVEGAWKKIQPTKA